MWCDDGDINSPNLLICTTRFNQISNWVVYTLVKESDIKKRVAHIKKYLLIADELLKLNNFNGVFEIIAGLSSSSVSRLGKTWEQFSNSNKSQKLYEKLVQLTSPIGSFTNYRTSLLNTSTSTVPYMGMFLSDLTFMEEGNPDFLKSGMVNFTKMTMVAEVIKLVQRFQQKPFNLTAVPAIAEWLLSHKSLSEKELFELSLISEPREKQW